jgi:hypothetical protein
MGDDFFQRKNARAKPFFAFLCASLRLGVFALRFFEGKRA